MIAKTWSVDGIPFRSFTTSITYFYSYLNSEKIDGISN